MVLIIKKLKKNLNIQWQHMFKNAKRGMLKNQKKGVLGLFLTKTHLQGYLLTQKHLPQSKTDVFPHQMHDWLALFKQVSDKLAAGEAMLTLSSEFYQILTIDKPQVAASEMEHALLWQIKDLVDLPLASIQLDFFYAPTQGVGHKIHVVVTDKQLLKKIVDAAEKVNIKIRSISIEELMLHHLFEQSSESRLLVYHHADHDLQLLIFKEQHLYSFRRIRGFHGMDKLSRDELNQQVQASLYLEIQRSLDFFESQLRQAPVQRIDVFVASESVYLSQLLADNFEQPIAVLSNEPVLSTLAKLSFMELKSGASYETAY